MKLKGKLAVGAVALMLSSAGVPAMAQGAQEKTPAFPGAEGFGRYVTGGRGGAVYHVTNLNDSGTGSLRWALGQKGAKTIVFDVSGTIHLASALNITGNTTLAGQTAPGDGICVADYPVAVKGNNVIVRYMRFRLGNKNVTKNGADGWDGFGGMDQQDIIIDHCSVSWSIDECLSIYGVKNSTVQWCISSQSLQNAGHSKGAHGYGGNWGGSGVTYHHNLMAHHESRVPRLGPRYTTQLDERLDMRNNVFYNWGGNGCYGGEAMTVNIVNNYYKPGPGTAQISSTKQKRIAGIGIRTTEYVTNYADYKPTEHVWGKFYVDGNVNSKYSDVTKDNWTYGIYNQIDNSANDNLYTATTKDTMKLREPMPFVYVTTHSANDAYDRVVAYAGCCIKRDAVDELSIGDTRDGKATYTGSSYVYNGKTYTPHKGIINSQDDIKPVGAAADWSPWPALNATEAPLDTDGDGMPDAWETANGLNPNDASDGAKLASNGYTNVENYLNSLVADITAAQNAGGEGMGETHTVGSDPVITEYLISPLAYEGEGWNFTGGFSVSNTAGKTYNAASGCGISGIKYSRNVTYTVNIPDGIAIAKAELTGYSNGKSGEESYLASLGGTAFGASDYVFPSKNGGVSATHTVTLAKAATGKLDFKLSGAETVLSIKLIVAQTSGIENVMSPARVAGADRIYTLDGRLVTGDVRSLSKGVYIINKKKVVIR